MKHRKQFRGIWRRIAIKGHLLNMGQFGLKSLEPKWITDRQIEAVRVVLSRETRKIGRYWMRIFPHKPYTKKPLDVRMGSGKGDVAYYVASVVPGTILFELDGVSFEEAQRIFKKVGSKLPIATRIITKENE
jgi:large subunit ribosomal protein L16